MSNSQVLAILFDGDSGNIFYAGQLVTGHVHLEISERIKIRGVRLHVTGKAATSWTEGSDDDRQSYSGSEEYLNFEIYLISPGSDDSEVYLEPSVYKYPFSFVLPAELPQSFEDYTGQIRYKAKAVIIDGTEKKKKKDEAEVLFQVIRLLDLNQEPPQLREPQVAHSEAKPRDTCCLHPCCRSVDGSTEINATINRGCFVPGETICIDGEIANRTNTDIKYSTITLFQNIQYRATGLDGTVYGSNRSLKAIANVERPFLQRGQTDSFNNISLVVPQVASSRLDGCRIIDISYYIAIFAIFREEMLRFSGSSAYCPIVIGNIPLRDDVVQHTVITSQPVGNHLPFDVDDSHLSRTMRQMIGCMNDLGHHVVRLQSFPRN